MRASLQNQRTVEYRIFDFGLKIINKKQLTIVIFCLLS